MLRVTSPLDDETEKHVRGDGLWICGSQSPWARLRGVDFTETRSVWSCSPKFRSNAKNHLL